MTGPRTRMTAGTNVLTPVRVTIGNTDGGYATHPDSPMSTSLMGSTLGLEKLPLEILQAIIQFVIPIDQVVCVQYSTQDCPPIRDARSLMMSGRTNYEATAPLLYGKNTFMFDLNPGDSLPLFLQNLRDSTFLHLRRVQVRCSSDVSLTHGLDLLLGCKSLKSLEIATSGGPLTKTHQRVLKGFRLEHFKVETGDVEVKRGEWLQDLPNLITSAEERTSWQQRRVATSRQSKLVEWELWFYKTGRG
ncbi:hypothetical protein GE09DRAFT_638894 [Coniochaeta sp. 2T2.1]|nr:hypothetical protein GE09DRAFT_638894 [Coniochaeta sp. 2T2.1]